MSKPISIVASGTRGDVQPYIALGVGLQAAGYPVRLISSDDFAPLAQEAGLEFRSLGMSIEQVLQSPEWRATIESGNLVAIFRRMNQAMGERAEQMAALLPNLLADTALLLSGLAGWGGAFTLAQQQNVPILQAYLLPITPTSAFPSPILPKPMLGGVLNRPSFFAFHQLLWQSSRASDVALRRILGLPRAPLFAPVAELRQRSPILYGYSPTVLPKPADWDTRQHVTGYWFLDAPSDWQPPADLAAFLAAGAAPVYIGFGSMTSSDPEATTRTLLEAIRQSGQRAILATGWGGISAHDLPETVFLLHSAPHSWLFPRMAAVVHHGGVGTFAAGLRAGVPTTIVPHFGDQPYWGQRVADLGIGTAPIPKKRLTAERLAAALRQLTSDAAMRQRAADLGARIRAEDGIGAVVQFVQAMLGER